MSTKEQQYFVDLVVPCFRQMFWHFQLSMSILETAVLGCAWRLNADRVPSVEKEPVANFADAIVAHKGVQPVPAERGPPKRCQPRQAILELLQARQGLERRLGPLHRSLDRCWEGSS